MTDSFLHFGDFWIPLLQIIGINIVLSGDNAVVIALAARSLPANQQKAAILWGSGAAVLLRVILTLCAVKLLALPWLKLIGSVLLCWIGIKLLVSEENEGNVKAGSHLLAAIRIILTADLVMSLDNVIAVAAAARGNLVLLIASLLLSIPLIVFGAAALMGLMKRFPIIITLGAGLLGWVAGEMAREDAALAIMGMTNQTFVHTLPFLGLGIVLISGLFIKRAHRTAVH
jgi:YjbE family integral membrane protein